MTIKKPKKRLVRLILIGMALVICSSIILLKLDYRLLFEFGRDIPKLKRPVSEEAIQIIAQNKVTIKETALKYGLSEVAIAGIILAEMSLDPGPIDRWEEWRIKDKYLSKSVKELELLLQETENDINERVGNGENEHEFLFKFNRPLTWSIGVCQITSLRAVKIEKSLATFNKSKPRDIQKVIESLLIPQKNIEYCGQELYDVSKIYLKYANIDIRQKPDILGTLFNTGKAKEKAMSYIKNPTKKPRPNEFGQYIELHSNLISDILNSADRVKMSL